MVLTQQVPEPVRNPVTVQIRVYGGSSECFGTRHPGFGPENPVNPWTKKTQLRTPRPVISSMGARHGPTSEKGLIAGNGPSIGKSATCKSYKTDRLVDMSRLWPGWGRVRNGSKMSRHREIQTTVRTKAPFTKTPFSRSRSLKSMELWPRRANTLIQGVKAEKNQETV